MMFEKKNSVEGLRKIIIEKISRKVGFGLKLNGVLNINRNGLRRDG